MRYIFISSKSNLVSSFSLFQNDLLLQSFLQYYIIVVYGYSVYLIGFRTPKYPGWFFFYCKIERYFRIIYYE